MRKTVDLLFKKYDIDCFDYTDYPHKSFWSESLCGVEYQDALVETFSNPAHGNTTLYVHIPFCVQLCFFCICHKEVTQNFAKVRRHVYDYLLPELDLLLETFAIHGIRPRITEVYLGGGSPTILDYPEFEALLGRIKQFADVSKLDRFCVEVDPRNVDDEKLRFYKSCGVTTVSLGVQDFDPLVQKAVNRVQLYDLVCRVMDVSRELFSSINFDLLAGLPFQTVGGMRQTIKQVVSLSPDRISFDYFRYNEEFYPHLRVLKQENAFPDAVAKRQILAVAAEDFADAGYVRTGFEHFAKPNDAVAKALARGDATYTSLGAVSGSSPNVIAVGRSGHGMLGDLYLFQNHYDQARYGKAIEAGDFPIYRGYCLSDDDVLCRDIIRRLRTYFVLDCSTLDFDYYFRKELQILDYFVGDGLVRFDSDHKLVITEEGIHFTELIASTFDSYTNDGLLVCLEERSCVKV